MKEKKDFSTLIKDNWFVVFLISSFILVLVSLVIRSLLPEQVPIQENTWNGITPGFSKYENLVEEMGVPIDSQKTPDGFELKYQSEFLAIPHQVVTDDDGIVLFMKEYLRYDEEHNLSQYTDEYGTPDLVLNDPQSGISLKANVFLEEGLVVLSHIKDGSVEQKWYFVPVDQATFVSSWGEDLTNSENLPERAN